MKLQIPLAKPDLARVVLETVKRNHLEEAYVKIIVTRGVGKLPLLSPYDCTPTIIVFAKPYLRLAGGGDKKAIRVARSRSRSTSRSANSC